MRIMALDVGDRRIGVAVCDLLGVTAQGIESYTRRGEVNDAAHFDSLIRDYGIEKLVVGLPLHMNGEEGESAEKCRAFGDALAERHQLPVVYVDERLTTVAAHRMMSEAGLKHKKHRQSVDMLAAVLILETYMQRGG